MSPLAKGSGALGAGEGPLPGMSPRMSDECGRTQTHLAAHGARALPDTETDSIIWVRARQLPPAASPHGRLKATRRAYLYLCFYTVNVIIELFLNSMQSLDLDHSVI